MASVYSHSESVGLIWSIADLLRGTYKAHDYGDVILPLVVLRRLDQALADTKQAVLDRDADLAAKGIENREPVLRATSKRSFYNTSPLTFDRLIDDEDNVAPNLRAYIERSRPTPATSSRSSGSTPRSTSSTAPGCCTRCWRGSWTWTCTRTGSRTRTWATSSRS